MNSGTPIDWNQLRCIADGDEDTMQVLINLFLQETEKDLILMHEAAIKNDSKTMHRISHEMAGSSGTHGMISLVPVMRKIESDAKMGDLNEITELLARAEAEFFNLKQALARKNPQ